MCYKSNIRQLDSLSMDFETNLCQIEEILVHCKVLNISMVTSKSRWILYLHLTFFLSLSILLDS
jgi:hypothetical protein